MTAPAGDLRLVGRLLDASNGTFLAADSTGTRWIYKPVAGETPLWDFPDETLGRREVAAYALSEALGLGVVPPTVWCEGPLGEGSAQLFIDAGPTDAIDLVPPEDVTHGWLPILSAVTDDDRPVILAHRDDVRLRRVALFDVLANNADRKASHLLAAGDRILGVDHGLTLHAEPKLRTVLWGWAGDPLTDDELSRVGLVADLQASLAPGLADEEWQALGSRARAMLASGVFPLPGGGRPAIPWPPL